MTPEHAPGDINHGAARSYGFVRQAGRVGEGRPIIWVTPSSAVGVFRPGQEALRMATGQPRVDGLCRRSPGPVCPWRRVGSSPSMMSLRVIISPRRGPCS